MERCPVHEQRERLAITAIADTLNKADEQLAVERVTECLHEINATVARYTSDGSHVRLVRSLAINRHCIVCLDVVTALHRVLCEHSFVRVDDRQAISHCSFDLRSALIEFRHLLLQSLVARRFRDSDDTLLDSVMLVKSRDLDWVRPAVRKLAVESLCTFL